MRAFGAGRRIKGYTMQNAKFRPNDGAIVRRSNGRILVGERSDRAGCWQFPQGGIKNSETPEQALQRELQEEISLPPDSYRISDRRGPPPYRFPPAPPKEGVARHDHTLFFF